MRLALFNTTLVIPLTEASYVTYMFTLFTSKLPYLKQQTSLYSDVLHMSILQVRAPASPPGSMRTFPRLLCLAGPSSGRL